ncbi:hypothetical protein [Bradyrhizobium sp. 1]|uniref:hypothetical protein n=1 Tax=Bradyrhizobium sp. 1 TaxID=241591 RepID=UPI001FF82081|nr:hypothetical protein [Bradyrhizobium sp. 1]
MLGRIDLDVAPPSLHLHSAGSLPLSRCLQFGHKPRLLVLVKGARYLTHHRTRRITAIGQVVAICGQDAHAAIDQQEIAEFLSDKLASKPAGILN